MYELGPFIHHPDAGWKACHNRFYLCPGVLQDWFDVVEEPGSVLWLRFNNSPARDRLKIVGVSIGWRAGDRITVERADGEQESIHMCVSLVAEALKHVSLPTYMSVMQEV